MISFIKAAMVKVSLHTSRTVTMTEVGKRDEDITVVCLTILLIGGMWKT